jgi:hypothetical protein
MAKEDATTPDAKRTPEFNSRNCAPLHTLPYNKVLHYCIHCPLLTSPPRAKLSCQDPGQELEGLEKLLGAGRIHRPDKILQSQRDRAPAPHYPVAISRACE